MPRPFRGERAEREARRGALSRGDAVAVPCRLRRTSARGWGLWAPATLALGGLPDGEARWQCADPVAVGFAITRGEIDLPFTEVTDVWLRSVRFQTEAFYGRGAEIVVIASDRATIEVAVPAEEATMVADRLAELLVARR